MERFKVGCHCLCFAIELTTSNPAFTEGGIRALIFRAERNGFNKCIRRIGRKILISKSAFSCWIEDQNGDVR
ncbi:MAG: hypothetical protein K2W92_09315 [Alphaproteobacteria bacterium]|nr:hypothetical protein [Alphaproteobacteria bacterium]